MQKSRQAPQICRTLRVLNNTNYCGMKIFFMKTEIGVFWGICFWRRPDPGPRVPAEIKLQKVPKEDNFKYPLKSQ